jgi:hypothetical protein
MDNAQIFILLFIVYALLFGAVMAAMIGNLGPGEMAPVWRENSVFFIVILLAIPTLILLIFLLYVNWKITLPIAIFLWLYCKAIRLHKISEIIIVYPIYWTLCRIFGTRV